MAVAGFLLAGMGSPVAAAKRPVGDSFWSHDGLVFRDSDYLLLMRVRGKQMCFTQPMGYTFKGTRVKGDIYRGLVHGPQWNTRQRALVKFERLDGTQAVTVKSRGIQSFGPEFYYRVARSEFTKSQFGKQPNRTLNIACNLEDRPKYP